jgi:ABC-2 type transport system ATP-binding protein
VLVSSHVLAEVAQLADDVVIIAKGRLAAQAPVGEVLASSQRGTRVRTPQRDRLVDALLRADLDAERFGEDGVEVDGASARVGEIAAQEGIVLHELRAESGTLEDVFLELTRGADQPA